LFLDRRRASLSSKASSGRDEPLMYSPVVNPSASKLFVICLLPLFDLVDRRSRR
jgi:hypothetical protein